MPPVTLPEVSHASHRIPTAGTGEAELNRQQRQADLESWPAGPSKCRSIDVAQLGEFSTVSDDLSGQNPFVWSLRLYSG